MKHLFTAGTLALSLLAAPAFADPATVMAPGGPGGGYDAMARLPFQAMQEAGIFTDGAQFTNKGGAGGTIGLAEFVNNNKGNDNAVMSMGAILALAAGALAMEGALRVPGGPGDGAPPVTIGPRA